MNLRNVGLLLIGIGVLWAVWGTVTETAAAPAATVVLAPVIETVAEPELSNLNEADPYANEKGRIDYREIGGQKEFSVHPDSSVFADTGWIACGSVAPSSIRGLPKSMFWYIETYCQEE